MRAWFCGAFAATGCVINPAFDRSGSEAGTAGTTTGAATETGGSSSGTGEPDGPLPDPCPALPAPDGDVITVTPDQVADLPSITWSAPEGSTIVLEPGTYLLEDGLGFSAPGVTLRSSTSNPSDVVLDGQGTVVELVFVTEPDCTVAEVTLQNAVDHAIHVSGSATANADGMTIYRVDMIDAGRLGVHINVSSEGFAADDGLLACSSLTLTDARRTALGDTCTSVSGISGQGVRGWHLRDNAISGLWCDHGLAGSAIRFYAVSGDTRIERNVIRDCALGILLGLYEDADPLRPYPDPPCTDGYYGHYGGEVVNNMVVNSGTGIAASDDGFDAGIGLWQVCGASVYHNTVVSAIGAHSSIEYRFSRTQAKVVNNLVSDTILDRDDAGVPIAGNLQQVDLADFVDPLGGDAHLVDGASAIDAGVPLGADAVTHDIDGDPRDARPDVGADEH